MSAETGKPAPGKFTKVQEDARRYVEGHGLERFLAQVLNGVVQAKPNKPRIWMIKFLAERCSPQELQEAGISVKGLNKLGALPRPGSPRAGEDPSLQGEDPRESGFMPKERPGSPRALERSALEIPVHPSAAKHVPVLAATSPSRSPEPGGAGGGADESKTVLDPQAAAPKENRGDSEEATSGASPGGGGDKGTPTTTTPAEKKGGEAAKPEEEEEEEVPAGIASRTEWRGVESWEELEAKLGTGLALPLATEEEATGGGGSSAEGGPRWLAEHLARDPEETVNRLRFLSEARGSYLYASDPGDHNLAMALAAKMGDGPWIEYLTDRGICSRGKKDRTGKTVDDYIRTYAAEHPGAMSSSVGLLAVPGELSAEAVRNSITDAVLGLPVPGMQDGGAVEAEGEREGAGGEGEAGGGEEKTAREENPDPAAPAGVTLAALRTAFFQADEDGVLFLGPEKVQALIAALGGLPKDAFGDLETWEDERLSLDEMVRRLQGGGLLQEDGAGDPASGGQGSGQEGSGTAAGEDSDEDDGGV